MKTAATHSYNAVPSILMVAPRGNTKLEILFDTPAFFSTLLIVRGSVADEEEVENAVVSALAIFLKKLNGFTRAIKCKIRGSVMNA